MRIEIDNVKFKVLKSKDKDRCFEVFLLKVDNIPMITKIPLCNRSTKSRAIKWVSDFSNKPDKYKSNFLVNRGVCEYLPKEKHTICISYIDNNKIKTVFLDKLSLANKGESIKEFDGINRIKEINKDVEFVGDKKIRMRKSKTITQKRDENFLRIRNKTHYSHIQLIDLNH